jgi:hypothetical protein
MFSYHRRSHPAQNTRAIAWRASINLCVLLTACSAPTVMLDTPTGERPIFSATPNMPGGQIGPPPGLGSPPVSGAGTADRSGQYTGMAFPGVTGGGMCINNHPVSGFRVSGDSVRFGQFQGTIAADGSLRMVSGGAWILGRFSGPTFQGQLDLGSPFDGPGCTYTFELRRTGP